MKNFSELNIKPIDELKKFNVPSTSVRNLVNCEIIVKDFVGNVKTEHGPDRYIVLFNYSGYDQKFFTNSTKMKNVLDQCSAEDFPFKTTIKVIIFTGGSTYEFS